MEIQTCTNCHQEKELNADNFYRKIVVNEVLKENVRNVGVFLIRKNIRKKERRFYFKKRSTMSVKKRQNQ